MTGNTKTTLKQAKIRQRALATWDNEGGTVPAPAPQPYRTTVVYDEITLPKGLRRKHRLAASVWCIIRVLEGRVNYRLLEPLSVKILDSNHSGRVVPRQLHHLEVIGAMRLKVEFYNEKPFA